MYVHFTIIMKLQSKVIHSLFSRSLPLLFWCAFLSLFLLLFSLHLRIISFVSSHTLCKICKTMRCFGATIVNRTILFKLAWWWVTPSRAMSKILQYTNFKIFIFAVYFIPRWFLFFSKHHWLRFKTDLAHTCKD